MFTKSFLRTFLITIIGLIAVSSVQAQKTSGYLTYRSLYWMDEGLATEVYVSEKRGENGNFSLMVISEKDIKVFYRTSINSIEPVNKELLPVKTAKNVKYYEINHHFTKMTIWMGLEFKLDNKIIESLTRTFYDNLFDIVPNDDFLKKPI